MLLVDVADGAAANVAKLAIVDFVDITLFATAQTVNVYDVFDDKLLIVGGLDDTPLPVYTGELTLYVSVYAPPPDVVIANVKDELVVELDVTADGAAGSVINVTVLEYDDAPPPFIVLTANPYDVFPDNPLT